LPPMNRPLRDALGAVMVLALALPTPADAQARQASFDRSGVSDSTLVQITRRGRAIAGYQQATWRATAKLRALQSDLPLPRHVAFHTDSGWTVAFGRMSASRDTFYVSHLAAPALIDGCRVDSLMQLSKLAAPVADTGYVLRAARAVDTATALFGRTSRPYESVVLPAPGGTWWVYMLPSPNGAGAYPVGDDVRYHVSADARRVSEARRLHLGTIEFDRSNKPDAQYVASSYTTAVSDIPEETDVAHILTRRPRVLGYVFTPQYLFMINEDGSLRMVMPRMKLIGAQR
jgi:hypothetical protein